MANNYFQLNTTSIGTKYFIAQFAENQGVRGQTRQRKIDISVTGKVNITIAPTTQRTQVLLCMFTGAETGSYGTFANLKSFHSSTETITFTDWDGTTSYTVAFINSELVPMWDEPMATYGKVQIELLEVT